MNRTLLRATQWVAAASTSRHAKTADKNRSNVCRGRMRPPALFTSCDYRVSSLDEKRLQRIGAHLTAPVAVHGGIKGRAFGQGVCREKVLTCGKYF